MPEFDSASDLPVGHQVHVIPGHRAAMNPESRDDHLWNPGSMLAHRPGMTTTVGRNPIHVIPGHREQ
jgi:hypothetical protein